MQNWFKLLGMSVAGFGVLAFVGSAIGAEATGRNAYSRVRMPSMPSMTINTTGNVSTNLQSRWWCLKHQSQIIQSRIIQNQMTQNQMNRPQTNRLNQHRQNVQTVG